MDKKTKLASIDLIRTCCDSVLTHLNNSKKITYDFRTDIRSDIETIWTELRSWEEEANKQK